MILKKVLLVGGALALEGQSFAAYVNVNPNFSQQADVRVLSSFKNDRTRLELEYSAGGFSSDVSGNFTQLSMKGAYLMHERGRPALPVIRWEVEVPSEDVRVKVLSERSQVLSAQAVGVRGTVLPSLGSIEKMPGALERARASLDLSAYKNDAFFPSSVATIVQTGTVRGRVLATIEIRPLQYNPVTKEIRFYDFISLGIESAGSANASDTRFLNSVDELTSKTAQLAFAMPAENPAQHEKMIVVLADSLKDNQKLAQYFEGKKARGLDVETVAMSSIGNNAAALRDWLRTRYLQAADFAFVMLVGDVELVPTFNAGNEVTDNYFASLDKADYRQDVMYPEVSVGRLAVKTNGELNVVMNKYLKYLSARFPNAEWIKKMAFLATDDRYEVAEGTHNYVIDNYTKNLSYTGIFPHLSEKGGDRLYAITHHARQDDVMKSLREGRVLISYSGHGAPTYWDAPRVTQSDVESLPPGDAFPFVMSHACVSGSYGMNQDSFGETWLKAPNAAIGFFGTSNNSYWDEDDVLERVFFDGMFREQISAVGQMNQFGLAGVRQAYAGSSAPYYYSIYNLLGDPSLQIFKDIPADQFEVTGLNPLRTF